jgi:hypothetical protein
MGWLPFQSEILCHDLTCRFAEKLLSATLDWGSDLGDDNFYENGKHARTGNSIASSHILALNYAHWHYSIVVVTSITAASGPMMRS